MSYFINQGIQQVKNTEGVSIGTTTPVLLGSLVGRSGLYVASPTADLYIKVVGTGASVPTITSTNWGRLVEGGSDPIYLPYSINVDVYAVAASAVTDVNVHEVAG